MVCEMLDSSIHGLRMLRYCRVGDAVGLPWFGLYCARRWFLLRLIAAHFCCLPDYSSAEMNFELDEPKSVLSSMLLLMILRRHHSTSGCSYSTMCDRFPGLMSASFRVAVRSTSHTLCSTSVTRTTYEQDISTLLHEMKLNCEDVDHCTVAARDILTHPGLGTLGRVTLAKAICFFGSRSFLSGVRDSIKNKTKPNAHNCIRRLVRSTSEPHKLFTRSFNPNRISFNRVKKVTRKRCRDSCINIQKRRATVALRMWKLFDQKLNGIQFCDGAKRAVTARALASSLGRCVGAFRGKNLFQLLKLALPHKPFASSRRRIERELYSETGPGCRVALNLVHGFPRHLNQNTSGQTCADFFNTLLVRVRRTWRMCAFKWQRNLPPELESQCRFFLSVGLPELQFIMCELSKVINFITDPSRAEKYRRTYSNRMIN
jgi:hypothetical protein